MKTRTYTIVFIAILIFSSYSCEENNINNDISGKLINNTDCKTFKSASIGSEVSDTLSCIFYSFDPSVNKLILKLSINLFIHQAIDSFCECVGFYDDHTESIRH